MSDDVRNNQRRTTFYNASGEMIPPYAVLNLVSDAGAATDIFDFCRRLKARQFVTADDKGVYALNGRMPVLDGSYGECTFATDCPAFAAVSQADLGNTPNLSADIDWLGKEWGPVDGKWTLSPDGRGFILVARPNIDYVSGYSRVLVMAKPKTETDEAWFVANSPGDHLGGNRNIYAAVDSMGNPQIDNISFYISGKKVKKWNTVNTDYHVNQIFPLELADSQVDLCCKFYDKLVAPGELVLAKRFPMDDFGPNDPAKETWMIIRGGTVFFPFCKTFEDINPEGLVVLYFPKQPLNQSAPDDPANTTYEFPLWPQTAIVDPDTKDWSDACTTVDNQSAINQLRSAWGYLFVRVVKPITMEPVPRGTWVTCEWQGPSRKMIITGLGCPCYDCACP